MWTQKENSVSRHGALYLESPGYPPNQHGHFCVKWSNSVPPKCSISVGYFSAHKQFISQFLNTHIWGTHGCREKIYLHTVIQVAVLALFFPASAETFHSGLVSRITRGLDWVLLYVVKARGSSGWIVVQSIQYGKWIITAHCFAWFRLGQFYYYVNTPVKCSKTRLSPFQPNVHSEKYFAHMSNLECWHLFHNMQQFKRAKLNTIFTGRLLSEVVVCHKSHAFHTVLPTFMTSTQLRPEKLDPETVMVKESLWRLHPAIQIAR